MAVNLTELVKKQEREIAELKKQLGFVRELCLEFTSLGRVSINNNNALHILCDQWNEYQTSNNIKKGI